MPTLDVFSNDAFSAVSLTTAVNSIDTNLQILGRMNLFEVKSSRTDKIAVELRDQVLSLIPTSPRGAPIDNLDKSTRRIKDFRTVRIAQGSTIYAEEIQNIRAFGSETELQQVQEIVLERQSAILNNIELTLENMRLGAIQGVLVDADGTVIYNWYNEFGVTQPSEIDFDLDNANPASGALLQKCDQVVTKMRQAAKGCFTGATKIIGLCGSNFWRDLIAHKEIQKLFELTTLYGDQSGLQKLIGNDIGTVIEYGGITFMRYWGTDDDTVVAIHPDKCQFFPYQAVGVFEAVFAPMESFQFVNTPGQPFYSIIVRDTDRDMWVRVEVYSYPLMICTRPQVLQRAKRT